MKYVIAGYSVTGVVLAGYALSLWWRSHRDVD